MTDHATAVTDFAFVLYAPTINVSEHPDIAPAPSTTLY